MTQKRTFGDGAATERAFAYDDQLRLKSVQTYRAAAPLWSNPEFGTPAAGEPTQQLLLEDCDFEYDEVNNITRMTDWRIPQEWPDGAAPVTRTFEYDDLYRILRSTHQYPDGTDPWISPFEAENTGESDEPRPSPHVGFNDRVLEQRYGYDHLGNTSVTRDDAEGFPLVCEPSRQELSELLAVLRHTTASLPETDRDEANQALTKLEGQLANVAPNADRVASYLAVYAAIATSAAPTVEALRSPTTGDRRSLNSAQTTGQAGPASLADHIFDRLVPGTCVTASRTISANSSTRRGANTPPSSTASASRPTSLTSRHARANARMRSGSTGIPLAAAMSKDRASAARSPSISAPATESP